MAKITGASQLNAKLRRLRTETAKQMQPAVANAADLIVSTQKRLCPVQTGALRESIQWNAGAPPEGARLGGGAPTSANETRVFITAGDRRAYYAPFVEFGTRTRPAHAFFFPGYRAEKKRAKAIIARGTREAVRAAVK